MKKNILTTLVVCLLLGTSALFAGDGHSHGHDSHSHSKISQDKAKYIAVRQLSAYVKKQKLAKSWKNTPVKKIKEGKFRNLTEWTFLFNNPNEKNTKEQNLYIFVNEHGKVTGANFTGK